MEQNKNGMGSGLITKLRGRCVTWGRIRFIFAISLLTEANSVLKVSFYLDSFFKRRRSVFTLRVAWKSEKVSHCKQVWANLAYLELVWSRAQTVGKRPGSRDAFACFTIENIYFCPALNSSRFSKIVYFTMKSTDVFIMKIFFNNSSRCVRQWLVSPSRWKIPLLKIGEYEWSS